jgi:hypothetical protein
MKTAKHILFEHLDKDWINYNDYYIHDSGVAFDSIVNAMEDYAQQSQEMPGEGMVEQIIRTYEDCQAEMRAQSIDWDENDAFLSMISKKVHNLIKSKKGE